MGQDSAVLSLCIFRRLGTLLARLGPPRESDRRVRAHSVPRRTAHAIYTRRDTNQSRPADHVVRPALSLSRSTPRHFPGGLSESRYRLFHFRPTARKPGGTQRVSVLLEDNPASDSSLREVT